MANVTLGNPAPHEARLDEHGAYVLDAQGQRVFDRLKLKPKAPSVTVVNLSDSDTLMEQVRAVADLWTSHGSEPPSFVASDDEAVELLLAAQFGCERGAPDDLEATHHTFSGPPGVGPGEKPEAE